MVFFADPNVYALTSTARWLLATSGGLLVLGLIVLHRESYSAVSRAFLVAILTGVIWLLCFAAMYSSSDPDRALFWSRAAYLGVPFIPAAIAHFAVHLAGIRRPRLVPALWLLSALFCAGFLTNNNFISGIQRFSWGFYPRYGAGGFVFVLYFAASLGYVLGLFWTGMQEATAPRQRARYRLFLIAYAIACLGAVDYLAKFGFAVYPFGFAAVAAFLVICAWANWRYRMVDITPAFAAEKILETIQNAVIVTDFYGTVRVMNTAAAQLLGRRASDLIGHTLKSSGIHFAPRSGTEPPPVPYRGFESSLRRPSGGVVEVDLSAAWLTDAAGTRIGIVYVAADVSGRIREASELARSTAEKDQLELFASIAAHDLRKPLNHIGSFADLAEMALGDKDTGTASRYLGRIRSAASRVERLIDGLLRYERALAQGGQETRVDLNDVLADVRATIPDLDGSDVISVGPLPSIKGMPIQIRQLFENLLGNAVKFRHPERPLRIDVTATHGYDEIRVSVRDNGIGFRREDAVRIFLPFERLEGSAHLDGHGLGLAICRRIATRHGGRIEADSQPGQGTEFIVSFPLDRLIRSSTAA
jgi:PAS domain S-box-containing protein